MGNLWHGLESCSRIHWKQQKLLNRYGVLLLLHSRLQMEWNFMSHRLLPPACWDSLSASASEFSVLVISMEIASLFFSFKFLFLNNVLLFLISLTLPLPPFLCFRVRRAWMFSNLARSICYVCHQWAEEPEIASSALGLVGFLFFLFFLSKVLSSFQIFFGYHYTGVLSTHTSNIPITDRPMTSVPDVITKKIQ